MIARCGLALFLSVVTATAAQAGVVVELVPETAPPYVGGPLNVEVFLRQDPPDVDRLLRGVQFDLTVTADIGELGMSFPAPHNGIDFWDFTSLLGCAGNEAECGDGYLIDDDLANSTPGPNMLWIAFFEDTETAARQINLLGNGNLVKVGEITVNVPGFDGTYVLDVVNAGEADEDLGAEIHWGFGTPGDPLTEVRANTGGITGGTLEICVGCDPECTPLAAAKAGYGCDDTLPRFQGNVLRLAFDGPISAPAPGEVKIRALQAGGGFGADLSGQFLFSVEGGDTLRIEEDGNVLADETWYGITTTEGDWGSVCSFEMDYVVVYGDANGSNFNDFGDLSDIFGNQGAASDNNRFDVNGSGFVDFGDISDAFGFSGSFAPAKPDGHVCTIP